MKNRYSRRIAACAAALAFVFGGAGVPAGIAGGLDLSISASAYTHGDYEYALLTSDGTVQITKYKGSDSEVVIPEKINGRQVTSIGKAAFYGSNVPITSVTVPEGVTEISNSAFYGSLYLTKVNLPKSLKTIRGGAFSMCTSLESIVLPEGLETLEGSSFYGCESLSEIHIPASVTNLGGSAFRGCTKLKGIEIDSENKNYAAFDGAVYDKALAELLVCPDSKKSISFPESITKIGESAFCGCANLTEIAIPEGVAEIGGGAFSDCTGLTELTVPKSVKAIGNGAFYRCTGLKAVTIKADISEITYYSFYKCASLESISLSDSVDTIGEGAFSCCSRLKSVSLPDSVKYICDYAFESCTGLESIEIPAGVKEIGIGAFICCESLKSVTVPAGVRYIGDRAFGYYYDNETEEERKYDGFTVICYKGSTAEEYAKDNGFKCVYISTKSNPAYSVSVSGDKATFNWTAVDDAEKYGVAFFIDGKWQLVAQGEETSYVMKNLKAGTEYKAAVIAKFDGEWNMDFSNAVTITTKSAYPKVSYEVSGRQFRLKWNPVDGAEKYGIALYQSGKWRVKAQFTKNVTAFTSPKIKPGSYKMVVCAKINGAWDTGDLNNRAFTVTIA
ncbi:MAG: fibronectin type III domain-containing protein [Ruminococcus sp.]|nr:fibronectin type III domain-containing protein [Ruminococcus sp.]